MNRVVRIVAVAGSLLALSIASPKVYGDSNFHDHAEASQHVMHIRKLADIDDLKIELEPVWFQLESAELPSSFDNQVQVKRQTGTRRPYKVYSHLENLRSEQEQKRNRLKQNRAEPEPESVKSDEQPSSLRIKKMTSVEEQLDDLELPGCFRKFLQEMHDRNHEGVRRLMGCLARQQTNGDRKKQRPAQQFQDNGDSTEETRRPYRRKVVRRTKNDANHEASSSSVVGAESDLMFQKHYIRSESDDEGQLFDRGQRKSGVSDEASDGSTNESTSRTDSDEENFRVKSTEAETEQETRRYASNEGKVPYRRPMQKLAANNQSQSTEEADDKSSSSEESQTDSDEHY